MNISFPRDILLNIYEYDRTYKEKFDKVIREINLRYDNGFWHIKHTCIYRIKNDSIKPLQFLTKNEDQDSLMQDVFHGENIKMISKPSYKKKYLLIRNLAIRKMKNIWRRHWKTI